MPLIKKVLSQEDSDDGWVNLGTVGKQLLNLAPDFDPRHSASENSAILSARRTNLRSSGRGRSDQHKQRGKN
ncbi:OST-HTH/LOTUS domain-containing protein [Rhizobium ruizarguesonis]